MTDAPSAFFIHVMKTGGTSFVTHVRRHLPAREIWPSQEGATVGGGTYTDADALLALSADERAGIRLYAGHLPHVVADLVGADVTMTVLRDPVERTISFLRHAKVHHPKQRDRSLAEIYEDHHQYGFFIHDYQVRQFAKGPDDDLSHIAALWIDADRAMRARENLARVDLVGFHDRLEEFTVAACEVLGVPAPRDMPRARVGDTTFDVPDGLRERIAEDIAVDVAFYAHARSTRT